MYSTAHLQFWEATEGKGAPFLGWGGGLEGEEERKGPFREEKEKVHKGGRGTLSVLATNRRWVFFSSFDVSQ